MPFKEKDHEGAGASVRRDRVEYRTGEINAKEVQRATPVYGRDAWKGGNGPVQVHTAPLAPVASKVEAASVPTEPSKAGAAAKPVVHRAAPKQPTPKKERKFTLQFIGALLYTLGFGAEYLAVRFWRVLRDGGAFFGQLAAWAAGGIWDGASRLARGVWRDATEPMRRFAAQRKKLKRIRLRVAQREDGGTAAKRKYRRLGAKATLAFVAQVMAFLLPLATAGVLVATIYSITGRNYALAVELNGEVLGYVADQNVVEGAKDLLRGRIRLASGQNLDDWQLNPTYTITQANTLTTTQQLANEILLTRTEDASDLVEATGLYVNDDLLAVTTEGARLREWLDGQLAVHEDPNRPDAVVSFVKKVDCDPGLEEVFFSSSVMPFDELVTLLSSVEQPQEVFLADGVSNLNDIAHNYNLGLDLIWNRNPELAAGLPEDGDVGALVPAEGTTLLVRRPVPYLQVQVSYRDFEHEEIPYEQQEIETDEWAIGVRHEVQEGIAGLREAWYDYYYIDGELVRTEPVPEMTLVLQEPQAEIIEVGTYDYSDVPTGEFGAYIFPVPASTWSSRGFMGRAHLGLDINAPTGTPIFACNEGDVIEAGWHYSYGWHVIIRHPDGIETLYAHCSSLAVERGQHVMRNTYIGAVGSTGDSTGPHCHLEFRVNGAAVDPMNFIAAPPGYSFGRYQAPRVEQ